MRAGRIRLHGATGITVTEHEDTMSYYEAARRVQKQREMEKCLEEMKKAMAQLERMIQDGEIR